MTPISETEIVIMGGTLSVMSGPKGTAYKLDVVNMRIDAIHSKQKFSRAFKFNCY